MNDDEFRLTGEGVNTIVRINELYRTTDYDLNRIAFEVGLENELDVRMLFAVGVRLGIVDAINEMMDYEL